MNLQLGYLVRRVQIFLGLPIPKGSHPAALCWHTRHKWSGQGLSSLQILGECLQHHAEVLVMDLELWPQKEEEVPPSLGGVNTGVVLLFLGGGVRPNLCFLWPCLDRRKWQGGCWGMVGP